MCGVPRSIFDALADHEQKLVKKGKVVPPPHAAKAVGRWLIRERFTVQHAKPSGRGRVTARTLIRIDQTWYHYARPGAGEPPRWIARTDPEWMPALLQKALDGLYYIKVGKLGGQPTYELKAWNPNKTNRAEVEAALAAEMHGGTGTAPHELPDAYGHRHEVYPTTGVLCRNGVLDLTTGRMWPNTPLWFSLPVINADYDHNSDPCAADTAWMTKVLRTQWADDPGAIICLQMWFGYVVSGRTDLQKWMLIFGPPGSSKSIIQDVLRELVGIAEATSLDKMNSRFGLAELCASGAQLAIMADIRFGAKDSSTAVGNLLSVTGEDLVAIERKHKTAVSAKLPVRFHGSANEMPRWSDNSAALQRRALILETRKGFRGTPEEDPGLKGRILDHELGLVLRWAVEGLALLNAAEGVFARPLNAGELAAEMDSLASPVRTFVDECCEIGTADDYVDLRALFRVWRRWAEENNTGKGMSQNKFRGALKALYLDPIRPGQRKMPDGQTGKWLVVWGIKAAQATYIERGQYGTQQTRTVSTGHRAGDPLHGPADLN